jgi:SAM-dependent methyltransferase
MNNPCVDPEFDKYSEDYDSLLTQGLSVSGEDKIYFARGRLAWLAACLEELLYAPKSVLDYGCGTGAMTPLLFELIRAESVLGTDMSAKSLDIAKRTYAAKNAQFLLFHEYQPCGGIELAFCNGVFHHIPLDQRAAAVNYIYRSLGPGGLFAFWENNPWNPGTRYVMSRVPFDRDAITLSPPVARRLLRQGGFEILRSDFLFVFPRMLRWLRAAEPLLSRFPLGAQYQILCRKPS